MISRTRIVIAVPGIALMLFGIFRLLTQIDGYDLLVLFAWLVGALIIHDGILSPLVVAVGTGISRVVPPRGRRFLQGGVITGVLIVVIALPLIYRRNSQPKVKAILQQNYAANLGILLLIVLIGSVLLYVATVVRSRQAPTSRHPRPGRRPMPPQVVNDANSRPADDHDSPDV